MPLWNHGVRHLLRNRHGTGTSIADHACGFGDVAFLLVDRLHQLDELRLVELASGALFESGDELLHLIDEQLDASFLVHARPILLRVLEPLRILVQPAGRLEREELGAERLRPLSEHVLDAFAGQSSNQHGRFGQSAPGCFRTICIERACKPERAVVTPARRVTQSIEHAGIVGRELLCRDVRRPPLIGDERNVHRMKNLMRRIGLRNDEGLALVDHATLEIRGEVALIRGCSRSAGEILATALTARALTARVLTARVRDIVTHLKTPSASRVAMRSADSPHSVRAIS